MTKQKLADIDLTFSNNTDALGQSTAGSANADTIDTIFQKLMVMLALFYDEIGGTGTVAGTADAITLATNATYPFQSLASGLVVAFKAASANTGAATINVDSLGVKKIRRQGDSALSANDIVADGIYLLRYDTAYDAAAGAWVLLNPTVSSSISAASTTQQLTGSDASAYATSDSVAALWEKGSDVASASTISLGEGGYFHITGTTTITDIDFATAKNGRWAWLVFDGALTLTYNATTLMLPGGADITTAAGDTALVIQDSSDNVKVAVYQRAASTVGALTLSTEQATTSGTTKDFSIPSGAKRIVVMVNGVSLNSAGPEIGIRLGDSGGVEDTGYTSISGEFTDADGAIDADSDTTAFRISTGDDAADAIYGSVILCRMNTTHTWVASGVIGQTGTASIVPVGGSKTLSGELTTVRLMGGTFDAGAVNVMYE
jgi:hypothetical protein